MFIDRIPLGQRPAVHNWECADTTERDAITESSDGVALATADIGKEARVGTASPYAYYRLEGISPLEWSRDLGAAGGGGEGGGVTDHGDLDGLSDNDHPQYALAADVATDLAGKSDTAHTHVIGDTTGLQAVLDAKASASALTSGLAGKADTAHTQATSTITGLDATLATLATTTALTSGLAGKADTSHAHLIADTTGLQAALDLKATTVALLAAAGPVTWEDWANTTHTLAAADSLTTNGKKKRTTNASAVTLTVPLDASVTIPVGSIFSGLQYGAGQITFSPESGSVNIRKHASSQFKTLGQYSPWQLEKLAANEWSLTGELAAV